LNANFQIKLELCGEDETQCFELRNICSDYRFVAVYLPGFPRDEEYEFNCVHPYFASIGLGTAFLLTLVTLIILLVAYMRLARKSNNYEIIEEEIFDEASVEGSRIVGRGFGRSNDSPIVKRNLGRETTEEKEHQPMSVRKKEKELKEMKKNKEQKEKREREEEKNKSQKKEKEEKMKEAKKREAERQRETEKEDEQRKEEKKREKEHEKEKNFMGWIQKRYTKKEREPLVRQDEEEGAEENNTKRERETKNRKAESAKTNAENE